MLCKDLDAYCYEINAYCSSQVSGYPFVVNIDNFDVYQQVIVKIKADSAAKKLLCVSDYCDGDKLPDIDALYLDSKKPGCNVVSGVSQYFMLQGEDVLKREVAKLLTMSVSGHTVFLLNGCDNILKSHISSDLRLEHRVAVGNLTSLKLPEIVFVKKGAEFLDKKPCEGIKSLLVKLESYVPKGKGENNIVFRTKFSAGIFNNAQYPVSALSGVYSVLKEQYKEIASSTQESWGTSEQWEVLIAELKKHKTFSSVIDEKIGSTVNLSSFIDERFEDENSDDAWYLWLAMKVFGTKENHYLSGVLAKSNSVSDFVDLLYMELLDHRYDGADFGKLYKERRSLIEKLPENADKVQNYCDHIGKYKKDSIRYLTDLSDKEKLYFFKMLKAYDYSKDEICEVAQYAFPELYVYMKEYKFTAANTAIPSGDSALYTDLTEYFCEYKMQKITSRIYPEFLKKVSENAKERPFNKLLPRISVVKDIKKSSEQCKVQAYFFDALGVEYLSYIMEKCDKYKLQPIVHIAHCELPSITVQNLDFKKFFDIKIDEDGIDVDYGTKELDELKHHSKVIDYTKRPEPVYLFWELQIIDRELRQIRDILSSGEYDKIIIISDHGASRLSVLYNHYSKYLELKEHGEHSGRCCKSEENPNIPEAAYENGYAVLGNYDRFKGSRKANVEVHGGASLEEVVVPIIELIKMPEKITVYITNLNEKEEIAFHNKETVSVNIFSNIHLEQPRLVVREMNENQYEGSVTPDGKNYRFDIPEIKRTGSYTADLYDGDKLKFKGLLFKARKLTVTQKDLF